MNSVPGLATHLHAAFMQKSKNIGIIMVVIGVIGILLPNLISFTLNAFVGGLFLIAALALTVNLIQIKTSTLSHWFKPIILFVIAMVILFHPAIVLSVLGLLIAIYFLLSGFANIMLAFELKPAPTWWFMLFNGMISFVFGVLVIDSWPFSASWLIGVLIGISFLFDGIALLSISRSFKKASE